MRRLWWVWVLIAVVVVIPAGLIVALVVTEVVGRVTVETAADGSTRTVYWRDYPGVAGLDPEAVLAGPSVEDAQRDGELLVAEMRDAISAEFDLRWVGDPNDDSPLHPGAENGFGGRSMLTTINAPTSQSTSVPQSWADKQRIVEIIGEVAARHGYSAPVLDHERSYVTDEDRVRAFGGATPAEQVFVFGGIEGPFGQWLFFGMQDPSKDVDGRFEDQLSNGGWERASVTLSYGANALLPAADRAEFERRLGPFLGLTQPEPVES